MELSVFVEFPMVVSTGFETGLFYFVNPIPGLLIGVWLEDAGWGWRRYRLNPGLPPILPPWSHAFLCENLWLEFILMFKMPKGVYLYIKAQNLTDTIVRLLYIEKWYFVTIIVLTYCEKKFSSVRKKIEKKVCKFEAVRPRICNAFEILFSSH